MNTSPTIAALAAALSKAQGEMKPALKDSENPHFKSKYADLASVWNACREPLAKHGLSVLQSALTMDDKETAVVTRLVHESGEWVESGPLVVPAGKDNAHGVGSAIKYGRRYQLEAMIGVAADDDDGNSAVEAATAARKTYDPSKTAKGEFFALCKEAAALGIGSVPVNADEARAMVADLAKIVYDPGEAIAAEDYLAASRELRDRIKITKDERKSEAK